MICAPPFTCRRAMSLASSYFSSLISRLKRREPTSFVRSPMISGRLSSVASTASMPANTARVCRTGTRGRLPAAISANTRVCSNVVPQQPPMMFSQPLSTKRSSTDAIASGDSW